MTGFWRDLAETYIHPGRVIRRKAAAGPSEGQLLIYLMAAMLISFLLRFRGLNAVAHGPQNASPPEAMIGGMFVAMLFFTPLFMYLVAMLSHLVAHMVGGKGDGAGARLALFWTLLAVQPLSFLAALGAGVAAASGGAPLLAAAIPFLAGLWALWIWISALVALERPTSG